MGNITQLESAWAARWHRALDDEAAELAALHLAEGREQRALDALALAIRGRADVGLQARAGLAEFVAAYPRRAGRALTIACSAGSSRDRAALAGTVVAALLRGGSDR
jgi:hypothetical protein